MTFRDVISRSGRNLRAAKLRTLLTALALAVGGFTLTITLAAAQGARNYTDRLVASNFDPTSLVVSKDDLLGGGGQDSTKPQEYDPTTASFGGPQGSFRIKRLTDDDLNRIRRTAGVADVQVDYQIAAQFVTRPGAKQFTATLGSYATAPKPDVAAGTLPSSLKAGQVLLPADYVSLLGFDSARQAVGQKVTVQVQQLSGATKAVEYTVAAVITPPTTSLNFQTPQLLVGTADAQEVYGFINQGTTAAGQYLSVYVKVKNGADEAKLTAVKQAIEKEGYSAQTAKEAQDFLNQIINVLQIIILVFGAITLVASFFGVVNTQYISVLERTREIGLMKALGMRARTVSALFVIEATWIGFLGAVLGSAGAIIIGTLLNPWISNKIGFGDDRLLVFVPGQVAVLIIFLMLITTIAGLLPARKAARLDPIEALRTE